MKKLFVFFLISLVLFSCEQQKGKEHLTNNVQSKIKSQMQKDSLVLKKYIAGEPFMNRIDAEIEVAKNWGFIIEYTFGDCGGTYDNLIEKFKKENKKTKLALANKFSKNWETTFQNQVLLTLNPWYFKPKSLDEILKLDTLKLNPKKGNSIIVFNSDNTFTFTSNTSVKSKKAKYNISDTQLFLIFPNGKRLAFHYKIKQNEIDLIHSK